MKQQLVYKGGGYLSTQVGTWDPYKESWKMEQLDLLTKNLVTLAGRDFFHTQNYINTSAVSRGTNVVCLSETTSEPLDSWTTLTGEITTFGLSRATASPVASHVTGTNVSIVEKTFTASGGSFPAVQVVGLNNNTGAPPVGTFSHIGRFATIANVQNGQSFRAFCTLNHG